MQRDVDHPGEQRIGANSSDADVRGGNPLAAGLHSRRPDELFRWLYNCIEKAP